jgi:hypothetical protein
MCFARMMLMAMVMMMMMVPASEMAHVSGVE